MPGDTPKACPTCKSDRVDVRCCENVTDQNRMSLRHVPYGLECVPCADAWHGAPLAFDAALAALDVEPSRLDAVRAAHRAEVEKVRERLTLAEHLYKTHGEAALALSARVAKLEAALRPFAVFDFAGSIYAEYVADGETPESVAVLCAYANGEPTGVNVTMADFSKARAALEDKP